MARRRSLLAAAAAGLAGLLATLSAGAAPEATPVRKLAAANLKPTPAPTPTEWNKAPMPNPPVDTPELETMRRTIDALTPEQRQRFKENLIRWTNLSPEEKKALRERDDVRRMKMVEEIDKAIKDAGLTLTPEQKEQFARRYGEERRLVEERLRKEMEEKRRPMVREVVSRLREEFATGGPAVAGSTPTPATPGSVGPIETPPTRP